MSTCKWKQCKKVAKNESEGDVLLLCSNTPKCENKIHQVCLTDLLAHFGDSEGVSTAVCGKRCFNAVKKAVKEAVDPQQVVKKRVAWHNDGPTPSISSVSCLIDWMTTGYNYSRYRGGESQNGETKATIAGEVLHFIASCGVTTSRTAKDIQTKIASLEQSFKCAQDWLCATGQGVEDDKSLREALTMRCPYYYNLYDIMIDRDSTRPLVLNTDNIDSSNESSDDDDLSSVTSETDNTSVVGDNVPIEGRDTSSNTNGVSSESTTRVRPIVTTALKESKMANSTPSSNKPTSGTKRGSSNPRSIGSSSKKIKAH